MTTEGTGPASRRTASSPERAGVRRQAGRAATAARTIAWLSIAAVAAAGLMALAHTGVRIPLVSALGPQGSDPVWPAAVVFTLGALVFAALAAGAFRRARWTWPAAVAVNALAALSMVRPYRGLGSLLGLVLFGAALAVLLSPAGRAAFRR